MPGEHAPLAISFIPDDLKVLHTLSPETKFLGFLISLIPTGISMFIFYFLIKLFGLYERGQIFSTPSVKYIRNIGITVLVGELVNPIYLALISAAMTWNNPAGERLSTISISGTNVAMVITAVLIILISWIMAEGHKLQEEQKYTV